VASDPDSWLCVDVPLTDYREALALQHGLVAAKNRHRALQDIVLLLEHSPVFTLGRRGGLNNLTVDRPFLDKSGISIVQTERGGDITYHGPGQLIAYPIIDLKRSGLKVVEYVTALETVMIDIAREFGIIATRNPLNRGIWIEGQKLGSIGITVRKGICFHGFALNVDLSLKPFGWINPCGLSGVGVTSLAAVGARAVTMQKVRQSARFHLAAVFGVEMIGTGMEDLLKMPAFSSLPRLSNA